MSGGAGVAGAAGSAGFTNGAYCAPCVESADCAAGADCVGGVNPRCGKACNVDGDCSVGSATTTCETLSIGGGATPGVTPGAASAPLGTRTCAPIDAVCGTALTSTGLVCNDSWANYANNFFPTTCIGNCHRHDTMFTTVDAVRQLADNIRFEVETGAMPQGQTLPEADRRRLLTWLACGAP
jgi:hypothetical protein